MVGVRRELHPGTAVQERQHARRRLLPDARRLRERRVADRGAAGRARWRPAACTKEQLRDTLFVLWFVLVALKLLAFVITGVDLQWIHHLWLLPCAAMGHVLGLRFHRYSLNARTRAFSSACSVQRCCS
jgi:hypothetical protein